MKQAPVNAKEQSVWNNFICSFCHKVINNRTYQITLMRSLTWAFLHFFYEANLDIIYFVQRK